MTAAAAAEHTPASGDVRPNTLIALLAVSGIVVAMTQTLVIPLIASLPQIFDAPASDTSWIITITLLVAAVATPVSGRLADMIGKKRIMLLSLLPLFAGSVLCAVATTVPVMVAGRGLQGLATGFIPVGISMLHDLLPKERTAGAIALMSSSLGIGGAVGLPFAAAVAQFSTWRILFWIMAVGAASIALLVWRIIPVPPHDSQAVRGRFDAIGAVGLAGGLVCLLLPVSKGSEWGWGSPLIVGLFGAALLILLVWGWWEMQTPHPLVDLRTTARPVVLLTNIASILIGFAMYAQSLILPQLMQLPVATGYGHGQTMLQMGLWMAPAGLAMTLMSPVGARITGRFGAKTTLVCGAVVMAAGYGLSALAMSTLLGLMLTAFVASAGVGLAYGAMPQLILGDVPRTEKAAANALNTLMRSIGTSGSAAVIGVLLAQLTVTVDGQPLPSPTGFVVSLLLSGGIAVVAAAVALAIPSGGRSRATVKGAEQAARPRVG